MQYLTLTEIALPTVASAAQIDLDVIDCVLLVSTPDGVHQLPLGRCVDADELKVKFDLATRVLSVSAPQINPPPAAPQQQRAPTVAPQQQQQAPAPHNGALTNGKPAAPNIAPALNSQSGSRPLLKAKPKPAPSVAKSAAKPAVNTAVKSAAKPAVNPAAKSAAKPAAKSAAKSAAKPAVNPAAKAKANDPCPCGSGKKYKKCHGGRAGGKCAAAGNGSSESCCRVVGEIGVRSMLATRAIRVGECIVFEKPEALVKAGEQPGGMPDGASSEWLLTRQLVLQGKRARWASDYVSTELHPEDQKPQTEALIQWVLDECQPAASRSDVMQVYWAVCNNAFTLDTMVLRATFGCAFFSRAAYFNHSCDPNCLSLRLGGNMAMYACRAIEAGEEIFHSYLPAHLLLRSASERGDSLHFSCECKRCVLEQAHSAFATRYSEIGFPPQFALTTGGAAVGEFKVSSVMGDDDEIVAKGIKMLSVSDELFRDRSLAAMEVVEPLLQSIYNLAMDSNKAPDCVEESVRVWHRAAVVIHQAAVAARDDWLSLVAAKHVLDNACVLLYVVSGGGKEACVNALVSLATVFGQTLDCMREDLAYFGLMSSEWHARAIEACQQANAGLG